jgi:uncharacterized protein YdbL (DUF1318 family)
MTVNELRVGNTIMCQYRWEYLVINHLIKISILRLAKVYGYSLEEIAQMNLDKLAARKAAGTIVGDGDGIFNR